MIHSMLRRSRWLPTAGLLAALFLNGTCGPHHAPPDLAGSQDLGLLGDLGSADLPAPTDGQVGDGDLGALPDLSGHGSGDFLWARSLPGATVYGLAVDATGNIFIAGSFANTIDLGNGPLTSAGEADAFLAKFDPRGVPLWSRRFGAAHIDGALALAVDATGAVSVAGIFSDTVDFGGGPLTAVRGTNVDALDIFVARFDGDGRPLWSRRFGGYYTDFVTSLASDAAGALALTGTFNSTIDFGTGELRVAPNGSRGNGSFVAKLAATGDALWAHQLGPYGRVWASSAPGGDVFLSGYFDPPFDPGGGPIGGSVLLKYLAGGAFAFGRTLSPRQNSSTYSIAADAGGVVIAGSAGLTVDFGGGPLVPLGRANTFLARFNAAGTYQWGVISGSTISDVAYAVALSPGGDPIITGSFQGDVNYGGVVLHSSPSDVSDMYVARYAPDGAPRWARAFGGLKIDQGNLIAGSPDNGVVVVGYVGSVVDLGGGPIGSDLGSMFVLKLAP